MPTLTLRPGRERPVIQHHPWIFSGAIGAVTGDPGEGAVIEVCSAEGAWLARGTWSSRSQIRARLFTWEQDEPLDERLLRRRIERALAGRAGLAGLAPQALRLLFAESDGLPGIIVDRYGDFLVLQLLSQGAAARRMALIETLADILAPRGIYERSDTDLLEREGLPIREEVAWGEAPPDQLVVTLTEGPGTPLRMAANLRSGQKTGLYLDQALNRQRVAAYCRGRAVLDCFCYNGGFTLHALAAGAAAVTALDSSAAALAALHANLQLNQFDTAAVEAVEGDIFQTLRDYRKAGRSFDLIILDPPKFANNQAQVERATRGYKDINMVALQILRPGGILATFSCSGLVSADLFQKVVFGATVDAGRDVQIIERLTQAPDHPVLLSFPEGEYLKGLICRVW